MIGKVFDRMESIRLDATKAELKIIDKLKTIDRNTLIYMSITELSAFLDVAEATILRFCRKLDYKGFQDFKLNLSQELGTEEKELTAPSERIAAEMMDAISETAQQIDYSLCMKIAEEIVAARKVCAFAVGTSSVATLEMRVRLLRAGINLDAETDTHIQSMVTANLGKDDFLILISVSGATKDIIHLAEIAKKAGTRILVITNYNKSPLAKYADYILLSSRKEAANDGGSPSVAVAQIYVVDVLCTAIYDVLGSTAQENRFKSSGAVADKVI